MFQKVLKSKDAELYNNSTLPIDDYSSNLDE